MKGKLNHSFATFNREINGVYQKKCLYCKEYKPVEAFDFLKGRRDGVRKRACKACETRSIGAVLNDVKS